MEGSLLGGCGPSMSFQCRGHSAVISGSAEEKALSSVPHYKRQHTAALTIVTRSVPMNSTSASAVVGNTLKIWTFSLQGYTLLTIKSVMDVFTARFSSGR
jgi:hypothetical protein